MLRFIGKHLSFNKAFEKQARTRARKEFNNRNHTQSQYRQIDILIIFGKIGFEWFSAHAEGFLKAVERKPSGEGLRLTGRLAPFRFESHLHPGAKSFDESN